MEARSDAIDDRELFAPIDRISAHSPLFQSDLECPPGIPLFGNLFTMLQRGEKQLEFWTELRQNQKDKSKALSISIPGMRMIDGTSRTSAYSPLRHKFAGRILTRLLARSGMYRVCSKEQFPKLRQRNV